MHKKKVIDMSNEKNREISQKLKEKKRTTSTTTDEYDLFNNPMINEARKRIPKEIQDKWKKIGEDFYNSIDFVDADGKVQSIPEGIASGIAYIAESIKSGMHISYLEKDEVEVLKSAYGNKWYECFGYSEDDCPKF